MSRWAVRARPGATLLLAIAGTTVLLTVFGRLEPRWVALGWVCLVPGLWALNRVASWRGAALWGGVLGVSFTAALFEWFPGSLHHYSQVPVAVCWLVYLLLAPLMQAQFITFALVRHHLRRVASPNVHGFWAITLPSALVYVGTEWLCPKLFADTLGQGFAASESLRQAADLAGAHGLTLMLLVGNECVLAALEALADRSGPRRVLGPLAGWAGLVLAGIGYGQLRLGQVARHESHEPGWVVGVVQANITNYDRLAAEHGMYDVVRMILDTHYQLSDALLQHQKVDLLIWPETVYPTPFGTPKSDAGAEFDADILDFVSRRGVPLLFGTYDLERVSEQEEREYNAATFLGPGASASGGMERSTYRKSMLFPLTEWIPDALDSPWVREHLPWRGYWKRGPGPRTLKLRLREGRSLTVAPLICYESIFPGYVAEEAHQGAELIVTLSNDSWFTGTPGPRLHLMQAVFRSIETRLPQVRVTNSGISALISPTGEVLDEVPDDERGSRALTVPPTPHLSTLMVAWGDWSRPTALLLGVLGVLGSSLRARRHREAGARDLFPSP